MSFTKNYHIICDSCGKFCIPVDEETPFGCDDPEAPEPLDPYHYCKKCFKKQKKWWLDKLADKKNWRYVGMWQKSRAEMEAAEKLGLVWLHSNGVGAYNSDDKYDPYQYILKTEYERLKNVSRF